MLNLFHIIRFYEKELTTNVIEKSKTILENAIKVETDDLGNPCLTLDCYIQALESLSEPDLEIIDEALTYMYFGDEEDSKKLKEILETEFDEEIYIPIRTKKRYSVKLKSHLLHCSYAAQASLTLNGNLSTVKQAVQHSVIMEEEAMKTSPLHEAEVTDKLAQRDKQAEREKHEKFISTLRLTYEDDSTIKIQEFGKQARMHTCQSLKFRNNETKEWKALLEIIRQPLHTYWLGPAYYTDKSTNTKVRSKDYDCKRKLLDNINQKLIKFLNKEFSTNIPDNFKLYELCHSEASGTYKFNFLFGDEVDPQKYSDLTTKDKIIKKICKLVQHGSVEELGAILKQAKSIGISSEELEDLLRDSPLDGKTIIYEQNEKDFAENDGETNTHAI